MNAQYYTNNPLIRCPIFLIILPSGPQMNCVSNTEQLFCPSVCVIYHERFREIATL
jgi:hypothetical protein